MTALPINLPEGFSPAIHEGEVVAIGQVIAKKQNPGTQNINIAQILNVKLSNVKKVLQKFPGEKIEKGDIIAIKKSILGTKKTVLKSNIDGTVMRYERNTGNLVVNTGMDSSTEEILSPIEGVAGICNNDKILINTEKNILSGRKSVGDLSTGEIFVLEVDDMYRIDSGAIGKIIIGRNLNREILLKGIGIGASGLIGTSILDIDIDHIREKNFTTPVMEIDEESMHRLISSESKKIFMDARTNSIIFLSL